MNYSKKMIIAASSAGVIGAAGIAATAIAATDTTTGSYPPIVQKLAGTFGLDPSKVNDVFKQQRQENIQNRQAKLKSTLDQAVKDGKLTQDQEDKLIAELQTLHNQIKTHKSQSRTDFKAQLDQWAKDNGISNLDQILPSPPAGRHHGLTPDNDANGS